MYQTMNPSPHLAVSDYKNIKVYDTDFRPCVKDTADTVTRLELWDWFKTDPPNGNYMFCGHPNVDKISGGLQNNVHSAATFAYCMRVMQAIAMQGFDEWNNAP